MLFSTLVPISDKQTSFGALKIVLQCIAALIVMSLLAGCGTTKPNPPVLVEQERVVVAVPAELTTPLKPSKPITKQEYLAMDLEEREDYLSMYNIHLQAVINLANNRLAAIKKLYGEKP